MALLIVEDLPKLANSYYTNIEGDRLKEIVDVASTAQEAIKIISGKRPPDKYLVDIKLQNDNNAGFKVLQCIKERVPNSLVIAYTAHSSSDEFSDVELSHFHYYPKRPTEISEDFGQFKELIKAYNIQQKRKMYNNLVSYYAQIAHIERAVSDGFVKLICYFDGKELECIYRLAPIQAALEEDFGLNKWVKVIITEVGTQVRTTFRKPYTVPIQFDAEETNLISNHDYVNSSFWKGGNSK